jgi:hypothetical protein
VLKKAGIVVATAAAGLLAVSPLAFAGDYSSDNDHHHHSDHDNHHHRHGGSCFQDNSARQEGGRRGGGGIIDVSRNVVQVPIQACNNNVVNNVVVGILAKNQRAESNNG